MTHNGLCTMLISVTFNVSTISKFVSLSNKGTSLFVLFVIQLLNSLSLKGSDKINDSSCLCLIGNDSARNSWFISMSQFLRQLDKRGHLKFKINYRVFVEIISCLLFQTALLFFSTVHEVVSNWKTQ